MSRLTAEPRPWLGRRVYREEVDADRPGLRRDGGMWRGLLFVLEEEVATLFMSAVCT